MHYSIIAQVLAAMGAKRPQQKFMLQLMTLWPAVRGRFNYTNLARYGPWPERTPRRWFGRNFDWARFNQQLLLQVIPADHELIAAMDASFVPKSGKHTSGLGHFFNGSSSRAEKGLELSLVSIVDVSDGTAYTLSARQTPPVTVRFKGQTPHKESRLKAYADHVKAVSHLLPAGVRHLAVDGYYTSRDFVQAILGLELDVVGKLRHDANLRYLYRGPQARRGRPRRYEGKVVWSQLNKQRWHAEGNLDKGVRLYSASLYHVSLKCVIRVALLQYEKTGKHTLLYSTDLKLSGRDIVRLYRARFQIEFLFRDGKTALGLSDCQARNPPALDFHWNTALCVLNLTKWDEKQRATTPVFSVASCKQRSSNRHLLEVFSARLGLDWSTIKSHAAFTDLCNYGAIRS